MIPPPEAAGRLVASMSTSSHRRSFANVLAIAALGAALGLAASRAGWTQTSEDYQPNPATPRSEVPKEYQWHPNDIFPDRAAWDREFEAVEDQVLRLTAYKGRLHDSGEVLHAALSETMDATRRLDALEVYASCLSDADLSDDANQALLGKVVLLEARLTGATSFIEPELVAIHRADATLLDRLIEGTPTLAVYERYIQNVLRMAPYTLSEGEERILALTGPLAGAPEATHGALLEVDMRFPDISTEAGGREPLTLTGFSSARASSSYVVRKQATEAFFGTLRRHEDTFAAALEGVARAHVMNKEARGFDSCLEAALTPDELTTKSYTMLIDTVRAGLPTTMHRYIALRKKVLKLEGKVTFANLYNPLSTSVEEPTYTYEQARQLLPVALAPLGPDYLARLQQGLDPANGWIDVYPNEDKRSGAYSTGSAHGVHPFVLHNYDNTSDALFTTAHEFGHALHSAYSNAAQPFVYADYTTFLAEVTSAVNEELLLTYLLEQAREPATRLRLLGQRLEGMRQTLYRQTLFAEFELRFHERAEAGEPLTPAWLGDTYAQLVRDYYGADYEMGPDDATEWMFISHFYYDFYVFAYATGLSAGMSLVQQIRREPGAADRYIDSLLKAGSSAPPLVILKNAGVDLESPRPIRDAMTVFEQTIAEFDQLWTAIEGGAGLQRTTARGSP